MFEIIEKHWQWIFTGPIGLVVIWFARKYHERIEDKIRMAVMEALATVNSDMAELDTRVSSLSLRWEDAKEDIAEIKGKLDRVGDHLMDLPQRVVEAMGGRK